METMSFHFGISDYIYYNNSVSSKNDKCQEITTTEIINSKLNKEGEKNKQN